jgi:hypothetical protein
LSNAHATKKWRLGSEIRFAFSLFFLKLREKASGKTDPRKKKQLFEEKKKKKKERRPGGVSVANALLTHRDSGSIYLPVLVV